jgi:hypothetical protein
MAVVVRFVDGTEMTFQAADSASLRGPVYVVSRWNTQRRKPDEIRSFDASIVTVGEVSMNGIITEIILGLGRARPSEPSN